MYRVIDFKRDKRDIPAKVATIEYDPNRSARIALLTYADGEKRYILQPVGLKVGDTIVAGQNVDILPGNCAAAEEHPARHACSTTWSCKPGKGGQIARSAGSSRAAGGQGRRVRVGEDAVGRDPQDQHRVLRDDRPGRQPRSRERVDRQGRPQPLARASGRTCAASR